jgi:hypothetical protein
MCGSAVTRVVRLTRDGAIQSASWEHMLAVSTNQKSYQHMLYLGPGGVGFVAWDDY